MKKLVFLMMAACSLLSVSVMFAACGHDHEFATEWSKDVTNHWHACVGDDEECTEVADKAAHTWNAGVESTDMEATKVVKTYTCTVCGQTKTEERALSTTITEEQWVDVFKFSNKICNLQVSVNGERQQGNERVSSSVSVQYIVTETVVYSKIMESITMGSQTEEYVEEENYFTKESGVYYKYEQDEVNGEMVWVRTTKTAEDFEKAKKNADMDFDADLPFTFADIIYDTTTKIYTVADINDDRYPNAYTNIKLQFIDGNLVTMSWKYMQRDYVVTVHYTHVSAPTLPTDFVNGDA